MTEEELREFLIALAARDLKLNELDPHEVQLLRRAMDRASKAARLAYAVAERPEETQLYEPLGKELKSNPNAPSPVQVMTHVFDKTGLSQILDENLYDISQGPLKKMLPPEDLDYLRKSGVQEPEAEIIIAFRKLQRGHRLTVHWEDGEPRMASTSDLGALAQSEISEKAQELSNRTVHVQPDQVAVPSPVQPKKRKVFNGIGKILSGTATGAGNVLLGLNIASSPTTIGPAVIASAALAVNLLGQGIGDLRGE